MFVLFEQELFESDLIRATLMELGGIGTSDLDEIVYTFQETDTDLTQSISKVATMVSDYIQCIEMDRFVAYETESELEIAAARLSRKNELLAGKYIFVFSNFRSCAFEHV